MTDPDDVRELLREALGMPAGPASVAAFEYAIAVADTHQDDDLGYAARSAALFPLYMARRADLLAVEYAWCLAYLDRHPEEETGTWMLWMYRVAIDLMPRFSAIPRNQLDATWQDMFDRYRAAGRSARSPWTQRRRLAIDLGEFDRAAEATAEYPRCGRDDLSDPPNTERVFDVQYAAFARDDAATLRLTRRLVAPGQRDDYVVAHATAAVLPALARSGHVAEGLRLLDRAARIVRGSPQYLSTADTHVTFLVATGDPDAAVAHFNRTFAPAVSRAGDIGELAWLRAGLLLARTLVRGDRRLVLNVPAGFVPSIAGPRCSPAELRDWLEVELPRLSQLADARNGNTYHADRLADLHDTAAVGKGPPA